jgi:AcrR family transcriptional regulator
MAQPRRERLREATRNEILDTARRQMAESGAAALSLRAIAREMDMTAPALYRYFQSRDDLVTALILAAFHSLADGLEAARDAQAAGDYAGRLLETAYAYRDWALAHAADFALIYGTPIPGYEAPRELTVPAAGRSFQVFAPIIADAIEAGVIVPPAEYTHFPQAVHEALAAMQQEEGYAFPMEALYITTVGWTQMHGIIILELFGHIGPVVGDTDDFYRYEIRNMMRRLGLQI